MFITQTFSCIITCFTSRKVISQKHQAQLRQNISSKHNITSKIFVCSHKNHMLHDCLTFPTIGDIFYLTCVSGLPTLILINWQRSKFTLLTSAKAAVTNNDCNHVSSFNQMSTLQTCVPIYCNALVGTTPSQLVDMCICNSWDHLNPFKMFNVLKYWCKYFDLFSSLNRIVTKTCKTRSLNKLWK